MTIELPASWASVPIGDVCEPVGQKGPDAKREAFRYIDLAAIDNKTKRVAAADLVATSAAPSRAKQNVRTGDVLFSTVRVYLENIAEVPDDLDGEVASTAFCVLRPASGVSSRYLYHYVTSRSFVLAVNQLQRGNSPPSVQDGDIRSQAFPLAPPQEQVRIASRIDELFSRIEEGERALERIQKLVERYRQSVLKAAVTGELTRDWREKNKGQLESGEALLARILQARRAAWEKAELAKMKAKGIKPTNDKWKEKYEAPTAADITNLPKLPGGWAWGSGAQLFDWSSGDFLPAKAMQPGDVLVYGGNGVNGRHNEWNVENPTLVIGRVGVHCGNVHLSRPRSWITDNAIYATRLPAFVALSFLAACLESARLGTLSQGGAQPFVNHKALNEVAIPLPPPDEQAAIVDLLTIETSRLDSIEGSASLETLRAGAMKQAVLKHAFSGALVPQYSGDEPAFALLERIAAQRGTTTNKLKRGPKTKTNEPA